MSCRLGSGIGACADMLEDKDNLLTQEQNKVLHRLQYQQRAHLIGGASSGKTHLAMLKARCSPPSRTRMPRPPAAPIARVRLQG